MAHKTGGIIVSIFWVTSLLLVPMGSATAGKTVDAVTVAERMDKNTHTTAEIKSFLKSLKGGTVNANGVVNDVRTGKTGNRIVVFVNTPKSKDFVVDVYVKDASRLHKGDRVSCRGKYHKYNMFTVNGITLKDGSCSK